MDSIRCFRLARQWEMMRRRRLSLAGVQEEWNGSGVNININNNNNREAGSGSIADNRHQTSQTLTSVLDKSKSE